MQTANAASLGQPSTKALLPLCVDLDGTLIYSDMLFETTLRAVREDWTNVFRMPLWLLKGKANLKRELAGRTTFDASVLPYNDAVLDYIRRHRDQGGSTVLVTASDQGVADVIAVHLGIFDDVIASDGVSNLKGKEKARVLEQRFGRNGFIYAGNDESDLAIWEKSKSAVVVNAPKSLARAAASITEVDLEMPGHRNRALEIFKVIRCYQWAKNVLVFVPPLAAHTLLEPGTMVLSVTIFMAFSLAASGTYVINDLLDIEQDRRHPRKRKRPFASGTLPLSYGVLGPLLLLTGITIGFSVSVWCGVLITLYGVSTTAYSSGLKKQPLVDVFILAGLYSLRLFTGGVAAQVAISMWMMSFSGFLFLGLAFLKRTAELRTMNEEGSSGAARRGYIPEDAGIAQRYMSTTLRHSRAAFSEPRLWWGDS